jgi:acetyl-CoA carboxylase biotin carboxyl carrier protein
MAQKKTPRNSASDPLPSKSTRVDLGEIERILGFMTAHGIEELEYRCGELHVRLRRQPAGQLLHATAAPVPAPHSHDPVHARTATPPAPGAPEASPAENLHVVKSPIVGTFYAAPSPDSPPFVKPGDSVKRGQILCIVEAMKLMNEIEADEAGEVVRQLAENGQPVEYGQPLFALKPLA